MSEDEVFVLLGSTVLAAFFWGRWFWVASFVAPRCSRWRHRRPLLIAPLLAAILLFAVLKAFSSFDVRDSPVYLLFYMALGAAWVGVATRFLPLFGLSARDDVVERCNPAAARAIGGALLGVTLCFAGGNIGNGPGWWVVVFCALLSTGALFVLWYLLDKAAGLADTVTIDRDPAAGLRLAAFFVAAGLILGRAVAGDWLSTGQTIADFVDTGWPALVLLLVAAWFERQFRPTRERPVALASSGFGPAAAYLVVAAAALVWTGWWS